MKLVLALHLLLFAACAGGPQVDLRTRPLQVSPDGRFIVDGTGAPFFWLGDTAWGLFEKAVLEPTETQPPTQPVTTADDDHDGDDDCPSRRAQPSSTRSRCAAVVTLAAPSSITMFTSLRTPNSPGR